MSGIERIAAERRRQIEEEGFAGLHDSQHDRGELAGAGACYALYRSQVPAEELMGEGVLEISWPFEPEWWKPTTPLRDLAKAGALIAAEIDRRERLGETD